MYPGALEGLLAGADEAEADEAETDEAGATLDGVTDETGATLDGATEVVAASSSGAGVEELTGAREEDFSAGADEEARTKDVAALYPEVVGISGLGAGDEGKTGAAEEASEEDGTGLADTVTVTLSVAVT